jgi:hypothetical protein
MLLRAACERDHRLDDSIAHGGGTGSSHDVTIQVWLLPAADPGAGRLTVASESHAGQVLNAERGCCRDASPPMLSSKCRGNDHDLA